MTAQLPEPPEGADRIFVTDNAVIMLDGATSFAAQEVPAATYAEHLGRGLGRLVEGDPDGALIDVLAEAIRGTTAALGLSPGAGAPSSTVAVCRFRSDESVDLLVLGDTQIAMPGHILRDDRLSALAAEQRQAYRSRLLAGHGYDDEHRALMAHLQREQLQHRNRPGGYWIAEADPAAARHSLTDHISAADFEWCVLATDGAHRPMEFIGLDDWPQVARLNHAGLRDLLAACHDAEEADPLGKMRPRAKGHDDKAVAVVRTTSRHKKRG